ncbi:putative sporulation protein YtxC [Halobacillus litoralis]|uniref:putative sporulation protein YtxC n=1 Tax=Halobacillus litoralis TaxID=45668 RepID=UPI001CD4BF74|nr:putative sporulation protein YtxC [Halobacillus litoralis]MCA0969854.1 putative sporulation protein YtxC [Halobacillus litoralis]
MVFIHFSKKYEAHFFYKIVVREHKRWLLNDSGLDVFLDDENVCEKTYDEIFQAFRELILARKWLGWVEGILKHRYYFSDQEEVERILEISRDFEDEEPSGLSLPPVYDALDRTLRSEVKGCAYVSFDELAVACLESVHEQLIDYTGFLIDEYKQEEAYQLLLHSWRERVHYRDTGVQRLHLLDEGEWVYFHDEGNPISSSETDLYLKQYPDESVRGLPENWSVTPALVHAPNELIIYTDQQGGSTFLLLQNIFEEKVIWKRVAEFPF